MSNTGQGNPNTSFDERSVEDRVIVVTGGSRGIGAVVVKTLAKRKAHVVLTARNKERLDNFVNQVREETGNKNIHGIICDQSQIQNIKEFFEQFSKLYDHIDVLINNASTMPGSKEAPLDVPDDLEEQCFRINIDGYYFFTKYALPYLFKAPSGFERTVIYVSSAMGWLEAARPGKIGMISYRATKAGEQGIMTGIHKLYVDESGKELRKNDNEYLDRVVSLHPGFVATGLGIETLRPDDTDYDALVNAKRESGALSDVEGADTTLWLTLAQDGVVNSGKTYSKRDVVPF
eukprot:gb/GECH01012791.1/.p1 GENE.gb/GECH01012791.1/~~gb/GECH01012791.1/.p1  ORF type:complete len:290 (+),score=89.64 gb/GECH01012791.1/:1-870(+)